MDPQGHGEHPLTNVERAVTQPVERIAEQIATLLEHERRGLPREEETRVQNRLVRLLSGGTVNVPRLRRTIIERLQESGDQRSAEIDALLTGATAVVGAIRNERVDFESSFVEHPRLSQFVGMNETLDAKRKIDLVMIQYESAPSPIIHEVRFIQVKAGAIAPTEQESILEAHREYYGEIVPLEIHEQQERLQFAERTAEQTAARILGVPIDTPINDQFLVTRSQYADAFVEMLINHPESVNDDRIAAYTSQHNISLAGLTLFLRTNSGQEFLRIVMEHCASNPEEKDASLSLAEQLIVWGRHRDPSLAEVRSVTPGWALDRKYVGARYFLSRTYSAGVLVSEQQLNPPNPPAKTLTRR